MEATMSSLVKKTIKGKQYFYIVDSKRVNGKPKIVNQIYVGAVDTVINMLKDIKGASAPLYSSDFEFGASAALYDLAIRLDIIGRIDRISPKRLQGLTVGQYLLTAMINRALCPVSKSGIEKWYSHSILSHIMPAAKGQLSCQRFWDNMESWTAEDISRFEEEFIPFLVQQYGLQTRCLVYDATNFFTYIDTDNEKANLAKRGHNKEKRNDLRIIGLSLMVTEEDEIPLFYETYEGNRPDSVQFKETVSRLSGRYRKVFGKEPDITLIFDRGNNSEENICLLKGDEDHLNFHYVGGLKQIQCLELYAIPKADYQALPEAEFRGTSAYRKNIHALGQEVTAVITNNPELIRGQLKSILRNRQKCAQELKELQKNLELWECGEKKKGKKPTRESVEKKIAGILSKEYMDRLIVIEWEEEERNYPHFRYLEAESRLLELEEKELGKTVLFTDQTGWETEKIVHAYRSAWHIESVFRQMKDTDHLPVRPIRHWTDQKIQVHIFCCVQAYRLCRLLQRELSDKGIPMSIDRILEGLSEKKQYIHYHQKARGLRESFSMSKCDDKIEEIIRKQGLEKYRLLS